MAGYLPTVAKIAAFAVVLFTLTACDNHKTPDRITDITGNSIPGFGDYSVSVSVAGQALGGIASSDALLITVTVTHPAITPGLVLHGYRVRYAPNALP